MHSSASLSYTTQTASLEKMYQHLTACDMLFMPPLSSRVDLRAYACKVFEHAVSFEAWDADVLVGMINTYLNDPHKRTGYITNVSVLKNYMGQGVASTLLQMCIEQASRDGFDQVELEVSPCNHVAISVYTKAGFRARVVTGDYLAMVCEIDT